jgi:putative intracellular protease/amidase
MYDAVREAVMVCIHLLNIQVRECLRNQKVAGRLRGNVVECVCRDRNREEAVQFDGVYARLEVVDGVVAIVRSEDKRVMAACGGTSARRLEIAPHVIRGIGSADETVISTCGSATHCGDSVTDEGVGAANSAYKGVVPPLDLADHHMGIADEGVVRVRSACDGVVSRKGLVTHRTQSAGAAFIRRLIAQGTPSPVRGDN